MYYYYCGIRVSKQCEDKSIVKHRNNKLFDVFIFVYYHAANSLGITRALHTVGTVPVFDLSN